MTNSYLDEIQPVFLLDNEEILWEGKPTEHTGLSSNSAYSPFFGIIWLSFSIFWTAMASVGTFSATQFSLISFVFPLFGLPFIAIGIYLVFIMPNKKGKKSGSIHYYITNYRIIIMTDTRSLAIKELSYENLGNVILTKNKNNTGNIMFSQLTLNKSLAFTANPPSLPAPDNCFYKIKDAEDVYKLIELRRELALSYQE